MAVSLAFGVMFATVITLILVPISYIILEDMKTGIMRLLGLRQPSFIEERDMEPVTAGRPVSVAAGVEAPLTSEN